MAAVVPATQQGPIRWGELAHDELTCQETQDVLTSHSGLLLEMVVYQGANLWCDTSTGALRPLKGSLLARAHFTSSPMQGGGPHSGWWPPPLSGWVSQLMWQPGARTVQPATVPR